MSSAAERPRHLIRFLLCSWLGHHDHVSWAYGWWGGGRWRVRCAWCGQYWLIPEEEKGA